MTLRTSLKTFPVKTALYLVAACAAGILAFAYFLEIFVDLIPCPLCIAQRIFYFLIGLTALLSATGFFRRFRLKLAASLMALFAVLGGAIALRQVWLQHFPPPVDPTRCGVSFGSFIDTFLKALGGAGNCAIVDWTLFGLSIAEWSLLLFFGFLLASAWLFWRADHAESYP